MLAEHSVMDPPTVTVVAPKLSTHHRNDQAVRSNWLVVVDWYDSADERDTSDDGHWEMWKIGCWNDAGCWDTYKRTCFLSHMHNI